MFFLYKQNRILYGKIIDFLEIEQETVDVFQKSLKKFIKDANSAKFLVNMESVHKLENRADALLKEIRELFYKKSLLPESREDILVLLECVDDITDTANHIMHDIYSQNIVFPEKIEDQLKEMLSTTEQTNVQLIGLIKDLFYRRKTVSDFFEQIKTLEHVCDTLQTGIIKTIFDSKIDKFDKILLRDVIKTIGSLSDLCESAGDKGIILYIKRFV